MTIAPSIAPQPNFNAIIEGSYHDDPGSHYKLARLDIPEGITVIHDGSYTYKLYEPDSDFQPVQKTAGKAAGKKAPPRKDSKELRKDSNNLEVTVQQLSLCAGPVLGQGEPFSYLLERPRTICFRDGWMYVDQEYAAIPEYVALLPQVLSEAWKIFNNEKYERFYEERKVFGAERVK